MNGGFCIDLKNFLLQVSFFYVKLSFVDKQLSAHGEQMTNEPQSSTYYVVKKRAVPEVLLKVVAAKKLVESGKARSINEAVAALGISRSSFYKYKDDIFEFHENIHGKAITLTFQMEDEPGLLSDVLKVIAEHQANILTIHQSIPIGGVASLSLSIQVLSATSDIDAMLSAIERQRGVQKVKIIAHDEIK
jgi:chorismate mutase